MDAAYLYVPVGGVEKEQDTTYMELAACSSYGHHGQPLFDHKITTTLPLTLKKMSSYVASCHSNHNAPLYSQFEVINDIPLTSFHTP